MKKITDLSNDWILKLKEAEEEYNFQSVLTNKLDNHIGDFTETTLLEIVLWKTNRYPDLSKNIINEINDLRKNYSEEKAKKVLLNLLNSKGFDLPMASTVLRFACPNHLQIIDQRVYRFIMPDEDFLKIPHNIDKKIILYFDYINYLKTTCENFNIPFEKSDRLLYQLDKMENKKIPIITYTKPLSLI